MDLLGVVVIGATGKMGREVVNAVNEADDVYVAGAIDISNQGADIGEMIGSKPLGVFISDDLGTVLDNAKKPCVVVDFTRKDAVLKNIPVALMKGVSAVIGTTGFTDEEISEFDKLGKENNAGIMLAPNFSLGAVLMMKYAKELSRFYDQAEIIEYHNDKKIDSPSGTAKTTADGMTKDDNSIITGVGSSDNHPCRGGDFNGVRVHSVRLKSMIAHQEVLFAGHGELLTIRHDSFSRQSFMPGVLMAVRKVREWNGLKYGLDSII